METKIGLDFKLSMIVLAIMIAFLIYIGDIAAHLVACIYFILGTTICILVDRHIKEELKYLKQKDFYKIVQCINSCKTMEHTRGCSRMIDFFMVKHEIKNLGYGSKDCNLLYKCLRKKVQTIKL